MTRRIQESNSDDGPGWQQPRARGKRPAQLHIRMYTHTTQHDGGGVAFLCEPRRPFMLPIIIENDVTVRTREIGFLHSVYTFRSLARRAFSLSFILSRAHSFPLRGVVFAKFLACPPQEATSLCLPAVSFPARSFAQLHRGVIKTKGSLLTPQPVCFEKVIGVSSRAKSVQTSPRKHEGLVCRFVLRASLENIGGKKARRLTRGYH